MHSNYNPTTRTTRWLALVIGGMLVILFGYIFALGTWQYGTKMVNPDSYIYLRTGLHLLWGNGLGLYHYFPDTDSRIFSPTSHYPPMIPLVYSIIAIVLNIPYDSLSTVVCWGGWVALLAGVGVFTYQLSKSPLIAALTIILPAISYSFWFTFLATMSEPLFVPLLVWLMVLTYHLPQRQHGQTIRLVGAALLLMAIILTRYSGVVVLAAVMLWWSWHWWYTPNRKFATLVRDNAILAASALPLLAMVIYRKLQAAKSVGGHLEASKDTFVDSLQAMLQESGQILLPSTHIDRMTENFGWYGWLVYPPLLLMLIGLLWYVSKKTPAWLKPHPTPVFLFLLGYVLLYTVMKPFFSYHSMNWRFMTTMLCLTIPLVSAAIAHLPVRWSYIVMIAYIGLNSLFSLGPTVYKGMQYGLPDWVSLYTSPYRKHWGARFATSRA